MRIPKYKRSTRGFGLATTKEIEGRDRAYSNAVNADYHVAQIQSIKPLAEAMGVDPSLVQEIKDRLAAGHLSFTYLDITDWGFPNPEAPVGVIAHCDPALETFHKSKLSSRDRMWMKSNQAMVDKEFPGRVFSLRVMFRYPALFTIVVSGPEDLDRISEWADDLLNQGESWIKFPDERIDGPAIIDEAARASRAAFRAEEERRADEMVDAYYASPEGVMRARIEEQEIRAWKIDKLESNDIAIEDIPKSELGEGGLPELLARLKAAFAAHELLYDEDGRERGVEGAEGAVMEPVEGLAKTKKQGRKKKK